jgi:hypothetical protein
MNYSVKLHITRPGGIVQNRFIVLIFHKKGIEWNVERLLIGVLLQASREEKLDVRVISWPLFLFSEQEERT